MKYPINTFFDDLMNIFEFGDELNFRVNGDPFKIEEKDCCIEFKREIPGVKKEDVEVSYYGEKLKVKIKWNKDSVRGEKVRDETYIVRNIEPDKIKAKVEDGVLTITLPRKEGIPATKINIE